MNSQYMVLSDDLIEGVGTEFVRENAAAAAIFLAPDTFAEGTAFTLTTYLVSSDAELELIQFTYKPPAHWKHQRLIVFNTFNLSHFPKHKLAIAIYATSFPAT